MTNFRYGFMSKANQPRITPKSEFVRKLEASQKAKARKATITVQINLAALYRPKAGKTIDVVFDTNELREAA